MAPLLWQPALVDEIITFIEAGGPYIGIIIIIAHFGTQRCMVLKQKDRLLRDLCVCACVRACAWVGVCTRVAKRPELCILDAW